MAIFSSSDQLYDTLRILFTRMETEDPMAAEGLLKSRLRIQFRCSAPEALVLFDARERPLQILYGESAKMKVDLDVELTGDALHEILLGELRLTKALGSGQLKPNGPVWKAMKLADLFHFTQAVYPQVVREQGLG
jgi:putative sterol carrier protein